MGVTSYMRRAAAAGASLRHRALCRHCTTIYAAPKLYDLAFSYRSFPLEVDFLVHAHGKHSQTRQPYYSSDIHVGQRVEVMYEGEWYNGKAVAKVEGGAWQVQCDVDASGDLTTSSDVRAPTGSLRVLELGAGPARHSVKAAVSHGITASALDSSAEMVAYGRQVAAEAGVPLHYVKGDMSRFSSEYLLPPADLRKGAAVTAEEEVKFDSVWCLLGTAAHLLSNEAWVDMFNSAADSLADGGTLMIELPHPRETFRLESVTADAWQGPKSQMGDVDGVLTINWGHEDDHFDPLTQVRQTAVQFELNHSGQLVQQLQEVVPLRQVGLQELLCLAALSRGFEPTPALYGDLHLDCPLDDDDAYRLVAIFTKRPSSKGEDL